MKKTKKILVTASLGAFALATAFGVQAPKTASAQTSDLDNAKSWLTTSFTMEKGASARIDATGDGLLFAADWDIPAEHKAALETAGAKYGMIIAPHDHIVEDGEINEDSVFGAESPYYFAGDEEVAGKKYIYNIDAHEMDSDKDGKSEMTGALINVRTQNFVREYVGRAYVAIPTATEGVYDYYFANYFGGDVANNTRSMYYVAQGLIEQNDTNKTTLQTKYIDAYATTAAQYEFEYTVNHHYNDTVTPEVCWGRLNETVNVADVLEENASFGYDAAEQAAKGKTSGRVYAGGRVALDVYYSQKIDTTNLKFNDVALAKASTFGGVAVEGSLPEGVDTVTYTYDNSETKPTTAGKYEAKASFNVSGDYEYLTPEALTASVRLVSDNATIGAHGANGFEINFTLSNQTATATDFASGARLYWAAEDYEEALDAAAYNANGVSGITMNSNTILTKHNMGTITLRAEASGLEHINRKIGGGQDYFGDDMSKLTQVIAGAPGANTTVGNYYKDCVTTAEVEGVTVSYINFKWRVVPTETGSTVTLYMDCGDNTGWIIYGLETDKKFDTAGYAGLRYNDTLEGVSYISNFSITELSEGFVEKAPTVQRIRSTNIEMSYTMVGGSTNYWYAIMFNGSESVKWENSGFANGIAGGNTIELDNHLQAHSYCYDGTGLGVPTWTYENAAYASASSDQTVYTQAVAPLLPRLRQVGNGINASSPFAKFVQSSSMKYKWHMYNVTNGDKTTMTLEMWLYNFTTNAYEKIVTGTNFEPLVVQLAVGVSFGSSVRNIAVIKDFKVVDVNA